MVTTRSGTQIVPEEPPEPKSVERKRNAPTDNPKPPKRPRTSLKYKKENGENDLTMCKFTEVPVETFTEVCSYLHPADLIALARTCKVFREILMKSSAEHIWYRAEDSVPNLPSYPWSNMSPPQYAALLFTRNCTTCGENTTSNADPFLLVRLCAVCRETELVEVAGRDHYLKEPMKLVCKTTMMHFRRKNAKKRPRGSGLLKYCLRSELEQLEATFKALSEPGCAAALARWKKEVHDEVKLRHEFGDKLHAFSHNNDVIRSRELAKIRRERTLAIEERLLDLGWTEADITFKWPNHQKWAALVEQPRPLTDRVWANLFPKLLPLLETNRAEQEQRETKSRKDVRQNQVHKLLRKLKLDAHPLAPVVRQLGFEPMLREPKEGPTPVVVRNFLECYPFISSSTALDKWPCFVKVNSQEMTREEVKTFFEENLEEIRERSDRYRKDIETDLVLRLLTVWDEYDRDRSSEYMVKVNDSEETTAGLSDVTRLLLRADVVFSRSNVNSPNGQGQITYYPEFLLPNSSFTRYSAYSWNQPPKFSAKAYHPHLEGERTAKAILESIGKPDASYLELAVMGERFLCERCFMQKPLTWKGLVQHYLDEVSILDKLVSTRPKFKTRHEIPICNRHDVNPPEPSDDHPLAVICTVEEADSLRANPGGTPNEQGPEYCLPCKNHGRVYVSNVREQMHDHLENVHGVTHLTRDVHYGLISDSGTFLEIGGVWKENWDAHYDRIKEGVDDTDTEQEEDFHDDLGILVPQRNQAKSALPVPAPLSMATAAANTAASPPIAPVPGPFFYGTDSEEEWTGDDDASLDGFGA